MYFVSICKQWCDIKKHLHGCHVVCFVVIVMDLGKKLLVCFSSVVVREFVLSLLQADSGFIFLVGVHVSVGLIACWLLKFIIFFVFLKQLH